MAMDFEKWKDHALVSGQFVKLSCNADPMTDAELELTKYDEEKSAAVMVLKADFVEDYAWRFGWTIEEFLSEYTSLELDGIAEEAETEDALVCIYRPHFPEKFYFPQKINAEAAKALVEFVTEQVVEQSNPDNCAATSQRPESGSIPSKSSEHQEGICPICGAEYEYTGEKELDDNGGTNGWKCPKCGATGREGFTEVFDRHYNICEGSGKV